MFDIYWLFPKLRFKIMHIYDEHNCFNNVLQFISQFNILYFKDFRSLSVPNLKDHPLFLDVKRKLLPFQTPFSRCLEKITFRADTIIPFKTGCYDCILFNTLFTACFVQYCLTNFLFILRYWWSIFWTSVHLKFLIT